MHKVSPIGWMIAGVVVAWLGWQVFSSPAYGQFGTSSAPASGEVMAVKITTSPGNERLILIDPNQQTMAVYKVLAESGAIKLESVRPYTWDLKMSSYNTEKPTPEEIKLGLERK